MIILVTFVVVVTKYFTGSNSRGKGCVLVHSLRDIMAGKEGVVAAV